MWPFHHVHDFIRRGAIRTARRRLHVLENGQLSTNRETIIRAAEQRTDDLEERADHVAESLLDRLRRNNFAEGIALAWGQGQPPGRHQGRV
jgi:flagellar biosynthesis/type III secretory pathway chaperone